MGGVGHSGGLGFNPMGRNMRTVWRINTKPSNWDFCSKCNTFYEGTERSRIGKVKTIENGKEIIIKVCPVCKSTSDWVDHFAVFPPDLVKTPIRAGCPKWICNKCGKPREKIIKVGKDLPKGGGASIKYSNSGQGLSSSSSLLTKTVREKIDGGYSDCGCGEGFHPGIVLDPFSGAGTTGVVAKMEGVEYIGIELNQKYAKMSQARINKTKVQTKLFDR
ncbi:MAG: DNA methyltransferase [bacterium]|nr:DNA methyltransferase [bacterium]